jgi:hypothetical protein
MTSTPASTIPMLRDPRIGPPPAFRFAGFASATVGATIGTEEAGGCITETLNL